MKVPDQPVPQLPHAAPFLLLDRVVEVGDRKGVFVKLVTAGDPCVAADGTLPAAFVLEAIAQAGGALLNASAGSSAGYLAGVDDFRTHRPVRAGDTLTLEVEMVRQVAGATMLRGRALVDGALCGEARFTLALPR
jgi:3-hydroxyacyl-[acyl-carrier-protein] dehydratase